VKFGLGVALDPLFALVVVELLRVVWPVLSVERVRSTNMTRCIITEPVGPLDVGVGVVVGMSDAGTAEIGAGD
jgi:hypothetical protein